MPQPPQIASVSAAPDVPNLLVAWPNFDQIQGSVSQQKSSKKIELAIESGIGFLATGIIGFGGGSPMDVAKLASLVFGSGIHPNSSIFVLNFCS